MKSKELKNYNLPDNRTYNETLEAKPIGLLLMIMTVGFYLIVRKYYIYGCALFFFSAACLIFLPGRRLIEFYDDYMILYNKARKDECNIIYYDDIKSWEYKTSVSMDELVLILNDGSVQKCNGYSKTEFENHLNKYIKDKKVIVETKSIFRKQGDKNDN